MEINEATASRENANIGILLNKALFFFVVFFLANRDGDVVNFQQVIMKP